MCNMEEIFCSYYDEEIEQDVPLQPDLADTESIGHPPVHCNKIKYLGCKADGCPAFFLLM